MHGRQLDDVVARAHGGFHPMAYYAAQADVVQRADQRGHRAQRSQQHVVGQPVDDLVWTFGVTRKVGFLALHVGDLITQARRKVHQLVRALDDIAAPESPAATRCEHFERFLRACCWLTE